MSDNRPPDPDFLERAAAATWTDAAAPFDGLSEALDEYGRVRAEVCGADGQPQRCVALQRAEQAVHTRLRALGWSPTSEAAETLTAGPGVIGSAGAVQATCADGSWQPARAALALVNELAAADRASGDLVQRMEAMNGSGCPEVIHSARRCHGLIADALLVGAVELAVRIGIPDSQLPR